MAKRGRVAALVCVALAAAGCGRAAGREVVEVRTPTSIERDLPSVDVTSPPPAVRVGPLTPLDPSRIAPAEAAAIEVLGASGAGVPRSAHRHGHGEASSYVEVPLFTGDAARFANQWLAASRSVTDHDTLEEAKALGFVRASAPGPGVGTHWVLWSRIAQPFDPTRPAMLLFDERKDPAPLVGYSYWLQSDAEPEGFAGPNDHWHQHTGLCVVNGWVDREESAGPHACAGTYLAGGDLWMLHAWVVPGYENRLGDFASIHPVLCPTRLGTPDIVRCPEESFGVVAGPPPPTAMTTTLPR